MTVSPDNTGQDANTGAAAAPLSLSAMVGSEIAKAVAGRDELIEQALITMLAQCHSQLEGVAGVGRWLVVQSLAQCLGLQASKIRCSADLAADDLVHRFDKTGRKGDSPSVGRGPLFGNIVLVENMSRLPAKLRGLIHQAMQERAVEVHGKRWRLPNPFVIFATRYPNEPAASEDTPHDDRFLLRVAVRYPPYHEEYNMAQSTGESSPESCVPVISPEEFTQLQQAAPLVQVAPSVVHYAVRLVRATRVHEGENPDFVYEWVQQGAGSRAVSSLLLAAKARAVLMGRDHATHDDMQAVAPSALRHRITTNQNAQSNGITPDRVVQRLLEDIPRRVVGDESPPQHGESLTFHDWIPIAEAP